MMALSKKMMVLASIVAISLVALAGCSNSTQSASSKGNEKAEVEEAGAKESEIEENSDEEADGEALGEGLGLIHINEGIEAVLAYVPEGFPFPEDVDFIEDETMHIEDETTNVVNITYYTENSTKSMYSQYIDYLEEHTEYSVNALTDPMLITAISDNRTIYIDITEENNSTKVYISMLPFEIPSGAQ